MMRTILLVLLSALAGAGAASLLWMDLIPSPGDPATVTQPATAQSAPVAPQVASADTSSAPPAFQQTGQFDQPHELLEGLVLVGIRAGGAVDESYAIIRSGESHQARYYVGDRVPTGALVKVIADTHVLLARGDVDATLRLGWKAQDGTGDPDVDSGVAAQPAASGYPESRARETSWRSDGLLGGIFGRSRPNREAPVQAGPNHSPRSTRPGQDDSTTASEAADHENGPSAAYDPYAYHHPETGAPPPWQQSEAAFDAWLDSNADEEYVSGEDRAFDEWWESDE